MVDLRQFFRHPEWLAVIEDSALRELLVDYPWYRPLQGEARRRGLELHPAARVATLWNSDGCISRGGYDAEALLYLSTDDVIDRFLTTEELRIVAQEGEPETEVSIDAALDEEDELVSEELAEIYLAQGLKEEAKAIYRKLSLLNPEKSIYFAELIATLEKQ
ncbi:MAG: hypothetical protein Q4A18_02555 [Rikenellaceae bacterium]|nr:hypothetical protein [Rikenellaceae bacterium]